MDSWHGPSQTCAGTEAERAVVKRRRRQRRSRGGSVERGQSGGPYQRTTVVGDGAVRWARRPPAGLRAFSKSQRRWKCGSDFPGPVRCPLTRLVPETRPTPPSHAHDQPDLPPAQQTAHSPFRPANHCPIACRPALALMWHRVCWRMQVRTNQLRRAALPSGKPCRHTIIYQDLLPGLSPVCLLTGCPRPATNPPHSTSS